YWLRYEKHTWILGVTIGWLPYQLILNAVSILAILFTPFMLWHLFKAGWYKAIITFCCLVILPFLVFQLAPIENLAFSFLLRVIPLVTFYFYTYVISYLIGIRINELRSIS
ncbi:MAG: hypothetical protein R3222_00140, partial [Balneolaceae bacterium]|nr:hypothetical protein [Balneolaceae bacterium]